MVLRRGGQVLRSFHRGLVCRNAVFARAIQIVTLKGGCGFQVLFRTNGRFVHLYRVKRGRRFGFYVTTTRWQRLHIVMDEPYSKFSRPRVNVRSVFRTHFALFKRYSSNVGVIQYRLQVCFHFSVRTINGSCQRIFTSCVTSDLYLAAQKERVVGLQYLRS